MNIQEFDNYSNTIINDSNDYMSILLNCHTTFMMTHNKNNNFNIKNNRMDWIISNFTDYNNVDKEPYYEYYKKNINDNYSLVFNPPSCFHNEMERQEKYKIEEQKKEFDDYYNDDVTIHYRDILNKYSKSSYNHVDVDDDIEDNYSEIFSNSSSSFCDEDYDSYDYADYDEYYDELLNEQQSDFEEDDYDY